MSTITAEQIPETWQDAINAWDRGDDVPIVLLGLSAHEFDGYEHVIWSIAFEIMRRHGESGPLSKGVALDETVREAWRSLVREAVDSVSASLGSPSGAQVGQASHAASVILRSTSYREAVLRAGTDRIIWGRNKVNADDHD